ncbi:MAG: hypothetical protein WC523_07925, partial [Patescibacteria group bacterium]
ASVNGFYFLGSRQEMLLERQKRYHFSATKFKLARQAAQLFRLVPFIEMIAVSNIIGAHNLRDGSDIDLFIVTSPKRLWLTRLFCAGLAKILGWRPTRDMKRNKICLSFYISSDNLNLQSLKLNEADTYFNYWLAGLVPVYDRHRTYARLIAANSWLKECLPNWQELQVNSRMKKVNDGQMFSGVLNGWEKKTMNWQLKIMPTALKSLLNVDTRVRVGDKIIKLYLVDRRREFLEKFSERLNQVLNK